MSTNDLYLGIDTSMYFTSVAALNQTGLIFNKKIPINVERGELGLRQSDAVFLHLKNLISFLKNENSGEAKIAAVAFSEKPRDIEDSYMPVFKTGEAVARSMAYAVNSKIYALSHQHAHIYSAVMFEKELLNSEYICLHASGGTTEILVVKFNKGIIENINCIGKTLDISAGKLIDRAGVKLGFNFPCGEYMDQIMRSTNHRLCVNVENADCNFSGAEAQAFDLIEKNVLGGEIVCAVFDCVADTFSKMLENAVETTGINDLILFGGVIQNEYIKEQISLKLKDKNIIFAKRGFSCDNAAGLAYFAKLKGKT